MGARRALGWYVAAAGAVVLAVVGAARLAAQDPAPTPPTASSGRHTSADIARCIRDPRCHPMFVVAHRAEGFGGAENSVAAVRTAVDAGVPVVEVDLRASKDGEFFLFHDDKLDRLTSGRGRVDDTLAADIVRLRLSDGEPVPRFEDVYAISRGRAVLSVDFKVPAEMMERTADWIHAHGSFDDLVFFANTWEEIAATARAKQRYPDLIAMVRLLDTRVTVDNTRAAFGGKLPDILHTERLGSSEVAALHNQGVKVYVNALPIERYWQPVKYFAIGSLIATRVDFVLTGDPRSLMRRLAGTSLAEIPAVK